MRVRIDTGANYRAAFFGGKTVRQRLDPSKAIKVPRTAEIEDIAINTRCYADCKYCYVSAMKSGTDFTSIVEKAQAVWGSVSENDRPFQVAIGGAGEPTLHKDWEPFLGAVKGLGIVPNYTTNGMHLSDGVLQATADHCGGVAVSYHPHLGKVFGKAVVKLKPTGVKLNAHVILGSPESFDQLKQVYDAYADVLDYIVVLPYQVAGRAAPVETGPTWEEAFNWMASVGPEKFAFGALFYEWLRDRDVPFKIDVYQPEIYSGYRIMDDSYKMLRRSSYDLREKTTI